MATATGRHPAPPASPGTPRRRAARLPRLFWALWTGILINRLGTLVEPFLGVYLVAARGFSAAAVGAVLAVYALGSVVSQITGGLLADTLGRRGALTLGMLANGAALIALGYVTAAPAVIAMTFAAGATTDIYRPAAQALVADLIPAAGRAHAYSLISWAANFGFSVAMLSGGLLAQAGFRWLFWADALTCAAFAALAWRAIPVTQARPPAQDKTPGGFADVLRDPVMAGFALVILGYMAVSQQAFTTLPIAMHAAGLPPPAYGLVMALNGIVIVIALPLTGRWLAGRDHSLVVVAGTMLTSAGFGVTALASSAPTYAGAVCIWTLGEIAMAAAGGAIIAGLAPAHLRGRYLGLYGAVSSLGALLAPLAGTQLLRLGAPVLWLTCGAVAAAAALGQIALAPAIRNRTNPSDHETARPVMRWRPESGVNRRARFLFTGEITRWLGQCRVDHRAGLP
jgi:MFS family permease